MLTAYYLIMACAIVTMVIGLKMVLGLRRAAPGGTIGKAVNWIFLLIILFVLGYFLTPVMPRLSMEVNLLFTAFIFFFGAVFVVIVLWLIRSLIDKVMAELGG